MESERILIIYLVAWGIGLIAMHVFTLYKKMPQGLVLATHAIPTLIALVMSYIFLLKGGCTIAQFASNSGDGGMDLWRLWFNLWIPFIFFSLLSGVYNLGIMIINIVSHRFKWVYLNLVGVTMSAFSFVAVVANFPSA